MENQLMGKPFWHPDASRTQAEQMLAPQRNGGFVIRRSSNRQCLALTHKINDGQFGHALIQWNGQGYSLEQSNTIHNTIEALIKSLDLRIDKSRPRVSHVQGQPVIFQVECITMYNAQAPDELTVERGSIVNIIREEGNWIIGELDGAIGKFPSGLTKRVPGSEHMPPPGGFGGPPMGGPPMGGPPMMGGPGFGGPPQGFGGPPQGFGGPPGFQGGPPPGRW